MHAPLRSGLAGPRLECHGVYILLGFETSLFLKVNSHPGTEELHHGGTGGQRRGGGGALKGLVF